jgi:phosphoglucosamine mutase
VALRFGTDGVRGVANAELTPELALALGRAAARVLGADRFVVGVDTRRSSPLLEAALVAGLAAQGADVDRLGVVPTPAVAHAAHAEGCAGAMVSASHNPFADNGIKLFGPGGLKLSDEVEAAIEADLHADHVGEVVAVGEDVGAVQDRPELIAAYVEHLVGVLEGRDLRGTRVVLDCANGAAGPVAPLVFERLGAEVVVINDQPDGSNINERAGATHPEVLRLEVVETASELGLAFDGDADRLIAVDHTGAVVDGDHIIAICAADLFHRHALRDDTVVTTVMANLGFRLAMEQQGIHVVETPVGDRYVLEALDKGSFSLGGEQSGHVIFRELATTGDGLLTGVVLLDIVRRSGRPLAELAAGAMTRLPQVLINVRVAHRDPAITTTIADELAEASARLGAHGRVLVRPSGTEPLIRVMV